MQAYAILFSKFTQFRQFFYISLELGHRRFRPSLSSLRARTIRPRVRRFASPRPLRAQCGCSIGVVVPSVRRPISVRSPRIVCGLCMSISPHCMRVLYVHSPALHAGLRRLLSRMLSASSFPAGFRLIPKGAQWVLKG